MTAGRAAPARPAPGQCLQGWQCSQNVIATIRQGDQIVTLRVPVALLPDRSGDIKTMKLKNLLIAATAILAIPAAASAQEVDFSANIGVTTDYVWRGVSQSDEGPALQAGFDASSGPFYLGTWASNVDFGGEAELEWDLYAGVKPTLGPVTFDFGVLAYLYPQETDLNVFEAKAAASISAASGVTGTLAVFYSPEYGKDGPSTTYTELSGSVPLPGTVGPFSFTVGGAYGIYTADEDLFGDDSYNNFKLSLTAATESGWAVELAYTDTDFEILGVEVETAQGRGILTLKRTF